MSVSTKTRPEALEEHIRSYEDRGVDGIIYLAWLDDANWEHAAKLFGSIPRVVSLWGDPGIPRSHVVLSDFAESTSQAVQHLFERGRRRIVHVLEDLDLEFNRQRRDGMIAGFEACGLPFTDDAICISTKDWQPDDPRFDELIEELVVDRKADAVIGDCDNGAMALMNALRKRGMSPGDDVAFVGWGAELHAKLAVPPLTSIRPRVDLVCEQAIRLASDQTQGSEVERIAIPLELVVRESSSRLVR